MIKIDELNILKKENSTKTIPIERYFKEMDLTDEQVKDRESFATDLKELFVLFFLLFSANETAGNYQDIEYYNMWMIERYNSLLEEHNLVNSIDDVFNDYINLMIASTINTTFDKRDTDYTLSDDRATNLATDQTNTVFNTVDYNNAIASGYTHKKWITENDSQVRDTHRDVNGVIIPIYELFEVGDSLMRFPKDTEYGADIKEICNCRCSIKYNYDKQLQPKENVAKNGNDAILETGHYGDVIHKSVGAKSSKLPDAINPYTGEAYEYVPKTRPYYPTDWIIAGKDCKTGRKIDDIDILMETFPDSDRNKWQKIKVQYQVYDEYGEERTIEVHSYKHDGIPRYDDKVKLKDGTPYVDEWKEYGR